MHQITVAQQLSFAIRVSFVQSFAKKCPRVKSRKNVCLLCRSGKNWAFFTNEIHFTGARPRNWRSIHRRRRHYDTLNRRHRQICSKLVCSPANAGPVKAGRYHANDRIKRNFFDNPSRPEPKNRRHSPCRRYCARTVHATPADQRRPA